MTEGTYHGVFEGTDEDGFEHRTNGEGMESSFSKMKRLLLVELEKPGVNISSLAKELDFEQALIHEKKGNKKTVGINFDKLPILKLLEQLEARQEKTTPETKLESAQTLDDENKSKAEPQTEENPHQQIENKLGDLILPAHIDVADGRFLKTNGKSEKTAAHANTRPTELSETERLEKSKKRSRLLVELLSELDLAYDLKLSRSQKTKVDSHKIIADWSKNFGDDILFYQCFVLPTLKKLILVSNGDASTFIIHDLEEGCADWQKYAGMDFDKITKLDGTKYSRIKQTDTSDPLAWKEKVKSDLGSEEIDRIRDNGRERKDIQEAYTNLKTAYEKWKIKSKDDGHAFNSEWLINNGFVGLVFWCRRKKIKLELLAKLDENDDLAHNFTYNEKTKIKDKADAIEKLKWLFKTWQDDTNPNKDPLNVDYFRKKKLQILYEWTIDKRNINLHQLAEETGNEQLIAEIKKIRIYKK